MSNCAICGRPLTNTASVARGVGPICGGRAYMGRIMNRFGASGYGWSTHAEWEKVNNPCYSCRQFTIPGKEEETRQKGERMVAMMGRRRTFDLNAIGGYCAVLKTLVDGNQINQQTECQGAGYSCRKAADEQPAIGLLQLGKGQYQLFEF